MKYNYRVCKALTGETVYEQHKYCKCESCNRRFKMDRKPPNCATTTTSEITKIDEMENFLKEWDCNSNIKQPTKLVYVGKYPESVVAIRYYYQF